MVFLADSVSPLKGRRVLVADRHSQSRTALREMVNALGCTSVSHVQSAAEVLKVVRAKEVEIILCDYHLEDQRDGQQLLEEVRQNRLISLGSIFMMITGEASYKKVVSVAEFAPDDYLIKPFTPNQLLERLVRVNKKKEVFARAYAFIESDRVAAALPECRLILGSHPQYAPDAYRLMIDVLFGMQKYDEAEKMLTAILARKDVPWAHMGLANIHYARNEPRLAEAVLEKVAAANPEYLGAQDFLARVKTDLAKPDEALAVLEAAGAISSANVSRLRRTGDLAAVVGDHEKCSRLYAKVLDRVRNSSLAKAEDFISLSNAYVQLGRMDEAEKVSLEQRRTMRGTPEADLVSKLMEYQRLCGPGNADKEDRRLAAIAGAVKSYQELQNPITGALELDFVEACFKAGHDDDAHAAAEHLLARTDVPEPILARARANLAAHQARKARAPAIVPLDQVLAMLSKLGSNGWDDAMGHACQASVNHWATKADDPEMLATARTRLTDVLRKYGINTIAVDQAALA